MRVVNLPQFFSPQVMVLFFTFISLWKGISATQGNNNVYTHVWITPPTKDVSPGVTRPSSGRGCRQHKDKTISIDIHAWITPPTRDVSTGVTRPTSGRGCLQHTDTTMSIHTCVSHHERETCRLVLLDHPLEGDVCNTWTQQCLYTRVYHTMNERRVDWCY